MQRMIGAAAALFLAAGCAASSATTDVDLSTARSGAAGGGVCAKPPGCEILEGQVTHIDLAQGRLVVSVDLAWAPQLRTNIGETPFRVSDATLFLPVQADLAALRPGEDILVRATPDAGEGRHALQIVRVDRN